MMHVPHLNSQPSPARRSDLQTTVPMDDCSSDTEQSDSSDCIDDADTFMIESELLSTLLSQLLDNRTS